MQMLPLRDVPMEVRSLLKPETFFSSYKCLDSTGNYYGEKLRLSALMGCIVRLMITPRWR